MDFHEDTASVWFGGTASHVVPDPSSDKCFDTINEWMQSCSENHPYCASDKISILPKRVIAVGATLETSI
jgi:hypothetical protein